MKDTDSVVKWLWFVEENKAGESRLIFLNQID